MSANRAIERAARDSYGRLLALLAVRSRDLAASEDALADAFEAALERWPKDGVPESPDAWLLRAALNRLRDGARHRAVVEHAADVLGMLGNERADARTIPDERLALLFVCAHPAIDPEVRTPLMLQVVLGMRAADIAPAFFVSPAAMAKRLVRAKAKIAVAGIPFELPELGGYRSRLGAVLDAVYAAYGRSWDLGVATDGFDALRSEGLHLAEVIAALLPEEPEALALHALLLYCESRAGARRVDGRFVPLGEQDVQLWDRRQIALAEALLRKASKSATAERYQLEAAIQSCHVARLDRGHETWPEIARLYGLLVEHAPSVGAWLAGCAAIAHVDGVEAAFARLERVAEAFSLRDHQPYWALRADLLARGGRDARSSYARATALTVDPVARAWLEARARG